MSAHAALAGAAPLCRAASIDRDCPCVPTTNPGVPKKNIGVPKKNIGELIDHAKKIPAGSTRFRVTPGAVTRRLTERFNTTAAEQIVPVHYRGGAAGMPDPLAGQVQIFFDAAKVFPRDPGAQPVAMRTIEHRVRQRTDALQCRRIEFETQHRPLSVIRARPLSASKNQE